MPETNSIISESEKSNLEKRSPSAQILSNVEMLVAMCEEQERLAATANEPADTSVVETAVEKSVRAAVNDTVANVVQTAISEALSGSIKQTLEASFSHFDQRIAQFDNRINQVCEQLNKLDSNIQASQARFDSLDEKIASAPSSSELGATGADPQLSSQLNMIGSDLAGIVSIFENKFASLERIFQHQSDSVNGLHAKLSTADITKPEVNAAPQTDASAVPPAATDPSASNWQQQKQAMMSMYGDAADAQPLDQVATNAANDASNDQIKQAADAEAAEIDKLKSELKSKLREAEVELSIKRARLSQERAAFERNQVELERRSSRLEAELASKTAADRDDDNGSDGIMDRFKRHLGS